MKDLLRKYADGELSADEFEKLSSMMETAPDSSIEDLIAEEWLAFESKDDIDRERKKRLYGIESRRNGKMAIAAGIAAAVLIAVIAGETMSKRQAMGALERLAAASATVSSGPDGPTTVTLPDGSTVLLNSRSTLSYPANFGAGDTRSAAVTGEGYFDIAKDPDSEFALHTDGMDIKVHGTKFNIYAYPESDLLELSLVEGSVTVQAGSIEYTLVPNEKAVMDRTSGRVNIVKTDNEIETQWLRKDLVFMHEPLYKVIDILERRFAVRIHCSEDIDLADRYTGTFRDRRVGDILDVLKIHYGFTYSINGNEITISKQ